MVYRFSTSAAPNATADATINFSEGQAPSSLNDSSRAVMARVKQWYGDISGAIATGGTSTAYTVTSNQSFTTLTLMDGAMVAFTPHATNGATVTLNVDGLGAKPLRWATGVELQSNTLILGTPYVATYSNSNSEWVLQGITNPYGIPLGAGIDFWGSTSPSSAYAFPTGQAISRTTYSTLFSLIGTTYGVGDGSTTFNLPDRTGRVSAMKESSATRLTSTYFGGDSTTLGATGGLQSNNVILNHTHTGTTSSNGAHTHTAGFGNNVQGGGVTGVAGSGNNSFLTTSSDGAHTHTFTTDNAGSATAHNIVQPTIICNYIIRVI